VIESLLASALVVALAEVGDKTQLLALVLALRFSKPWPIIAGIAAATFANHLGAAWVGQEAIGLLEGPAARIVVAVSFVLIGLWALRADHLEEDKAPPVAAYGAFVSTLVGFFLVEIGDKTQIAAIVLAARYQSLATVVTGTTLGMLLVNVPVVIAGQKVVRYLPVRAIRYAAAALFVTLAVLAALGVGAHELGAGPP
jgi:putative Ca2+/H+ antiporter (TMEM165/GDT1 family)